VRVVTTMNGFSRRGVTLHPPAGHARRSTGRERISDARAGSHTGRARVGAALARASARELIWGLRLVSEEVEGWRARAAQIPDPELRGDALTAIRRKRGNINGAGLFWTLPEERNRDLLGVLVAYEILADYLDCVSERTASLGVANGRQLHLALVEAVDPAAGMSEYYRHHRTGNDGGYVRTLVESCRAHCAALPGYQEVRPFLLRAAGLSAVLAINHEPDPALREQALQEWDDDHAAEQPGRERDISGQAWYERTAGASAWLTVLAMLALAAEPAQANSRAEQTYAAYLGWIAPAGAMLDSYGDIAEDTEAGEHSYIAHYPNMEIAVERVSELVGRSRSEARALGGGARHDVIAACMIAYYLSKDSVRAPELRQSTRKLRRAGGPLVAVLAPVLRVWRIAYGQRAA
jgi:tetraprenyl-beta-curcumene synthase